MDVPEAFWKLCQRFFQDVFDLVPPNEDALISFLIRGLSASERAELAQFLDHVLAQPDASARLVQLWKKSQADFFLNPEERVAIFFGDIHKRL